MNPVDGVIEEAGKPQVPVHGKKLNICQLMIQPSPESAQNIAAFASLPERQTHGQLRIRLVLLGPVNLKSDPVASAVLFCEAFFDAVQVSHHNIRADAQKVKYPKARIRGNGHIPCSVFYEFTGETGIYPSARDDKTSLTFHIR